MPTQVDIAVGVAISVARSRRPSLQKIDRVDIIGLVRISFKILQKRVLTFSVVVFLSTLAFFVQPSLTSAAGSIDASFESSFTRRHHIGNACFSPRFEKDDGTFIRVRPRRTLTDFVARAKRTDPTTITGVFVCDVLALQVAQQPLDSLVFVSEEFDTATQSRLAANYGTIGLLAHNHLSGSKFFDLAGGQEVDIVYGDGAVRRFMISEIRHFQALEPDSPYSDFGDLDNGEVLLSSTQVFNQFFASGNQVVFQTCITANGNRSWGRLFVTAMPITSN